MFSEEITCNTKDVRHTDTLLMLCAKMDGFGSIDNVLVYKNLLLGQGTR
jgi:hypothetical protein